MTPGYDRDALMTPREVASALGVDSRTVGRWRREGRLAAIKTPGGTSRYRRADIEAQITASESPRRSP